MQNYSGPSRPSHPYGIYAQNTVSEEDLITDPVPNQVAAVANVGPAQTYQRRQGPDGEEADDLVGPDGHTEQLPPYTKYPNDLPPKERVSIPQSNSNMVETSFNDPQQTTYGSPTSSAEIRSPVSHNPNTGTISENNQQVHGPAQSDNFIQVNSPQPTSNPLADEGGHFKEAVRSKSQKRVCGQPMWRLIIVVAVFLVAITIGGTVGGILRHKESVREVAAAKSSQLPA